MKKKNEFTEGEYLENSNLSEHCVTPLRSINRALKNQRLLGHITGRKVLFWNFQKRRIEMKEKVLKALWYTWMLLPIGLSCFVLPIPCFGVWVLITTGDPEALILLMPVIFS